jgi:hypothetical protein
VITVPINLDRLDDVGPIATALRDQASKLRATADNLDAAASQVLEAGQAEIMRIANTPFSQLPPAPATPDMSGRITTGQAPDPRTGGVAMSDNDVAQLVQAVGPQPGQTQQTPQPVTRPTGPGAATTPPELDETGLPDHIELVG